MMNILDFSTVVIEYTDKNNIKSLLSWIMKKIFNHHTQFGIQGPLLLTGIS